MADPARWDVSVRMNIPWITVLTLTDGDGDAINLTGATAAMQVRLYQGAAGDPLVDLTEVASAIEGIEWTDPTAGEMTIRIDQATLELLPDTVGRNAPLILYHDLIVYDPDGVVLLCLYGSFTASTGVTR